MDTITSDPGLETVFNACRRAVAHAEKTAKPVRFVRSGTECEVFPDDAIETAASRYYAALRAGNHATL